MEAETNFSSITPAVFNEDNYQTWAASMETYLEALDLWEAVKEDYDIPALLNNPTMPQIKAHKEKKKRRNQRLRLACSLRCHPRFSQESCPLKQQKQYGIILNKNVQKTKG